MNIDQVDILIAKGNFEEARAEISKMISSPAESNYTRALLYGKMGKSYTAQWRFYDAVPFFQKSIRLLLSKNHRGKEWDFHYISIHLEYCFALHTTRSFSAYTHTMQQLKPIIESHGDNNQRIQYLRLIYMDMLVRYRWFMLPDEAMVVCRSLVTLAKAQKNIVIETDGLNNLSFTYMLNRQPAECRKYALQAIELMGTSDNDEAKNMAYSYMCGSYRQEKSLEATEQWHKILNAHVERNKNPVSQMLSDSMLAWIYYAKGNFELSEKTSLGVFKYMIKQRFPFLPVCSFLLLALNLKKNRLPACIQQAFILLHPNIQQIPKPIADLLRAGIRTYYLNEPAQAKKHFSEAIDKADSLGYL
jgi:hypothetical protein